MFALKVVSAALLLPVSVAAAQATPALQKGQKSPIRGLVTMGDIGIIMDTSRHPDALREVTAHPGVYAAVVIVSKWSTLEPEVGKFDDSEIEVALKGIKAYNLKYPKTPIVGKLRVFAGPNAPAWAKAMPGGPIDLAKHGGVLVVGPFWTKPYIAAWRDLQKHLAARFDTDPLLQEVAITSCASTSGEPFVISMQNENVAAFKAANFDEPLMKACLAGAADDYAPWTHVVLDYTFNGYRELEPDGKIVQKYDFPLQVMTDFRKRFGARAVIANHGLQEENTPSVQAIVDDMIKLGPPLAFQTAHQKGSFDVMVQHAHDYGATEFEMWDTKATGKGPQVTPEQLQAWLTLIPAK